MIRLLALDLDGTVLDSHGRVARRRIGGRSRARSTRVSRSRLPPAAATTSRGRSSISCPAPLTLILSNGAIVKSATDRRCCAGLLPRAAARARAGEDRRQHRARRRSSSIGDAGRAGRVRAIDWTTAGTASSTRRNRPFVSEQSPLEDALTEDPVQVMFTGRLRADAAAVRRPAQAAATRRCRVTRSRSPSTSRDFSLVDVAAGRLLEGRGAARLGGGSGHPGQPGHGGGRQPERPGDARVRRHGRSSWATASPRSRRAAGRPPRRTTTRALRRRLRRSSSPRRPTLSDTNRCGSRGYNESMPGGLRGGLGCHGPRPRGHGGRTPRARRSRPRRPRRRSRPQAAWREARALILARRGRLALGLSLMLVNRLVGLVLPATSKFLIDDVIGKGQADLLMPLALAAGAATIVQAVTSFALSQVLGVAAQRAITDMRRRVEAHVARLPVRYFDSTQAGVLISRIMTDAEGIRNLVGTGLVQLIGSIVTAVDRARHPLLPELVADARHARRARDVRRRDGAGVQPPAAALPRARQDQRRGHRPPERDARRHPHRQDLHRREARGAGLHQGRAPPVPQHREVDHRRLGDHRVLDRRRRRHRRHHDRDRRPVDPRRAR